MDSSIIFILQFITSLAIYTLVFVLFVFPFLKKIKLTNALLILLFPHLFRHVALAHLASGIVVDKNMPMAFSIPTAIGDYVTLLLAIISVWALKKNFKNPLSFVWAFNIFGFCDALLALFNGAKYSAYLYMGPMWLVVTFWVPLLMVSHVSIFILLIYNSYKFKKLK
jgi:hypothetical protein